MKMRTIFSALILTLMLGSLAIQVSARKPDFVRSDEIYRPSGNLVDVDIIGDNRGQIPVMGGRHSSNFYVEAQQGERYTIQVRNNWHGRVALSISVDGRNIISGNRSYNRSNESMYVLNPGQTGNFDGWRSSYSQVQRFYFTSDDDSYAGRQGDYSQIGWIKIAVYRERYYEPPIDYLKEDRARASAKSMSEQAGTGYGEGRYSPVRTTTFDTENFAAQLVSIKYEWPETPIKYNKDYYYQHDENDNGFAMPPRRRN